MICEIAPSAIVSSTPVSVTVRGVAQLIVVNVRLVGLAVASVASGALTESTTSAAGCELSATVKLAVPPASVVTSAPVVSFTQTRIVVVVGTGEERRRDAVEVAVARCARHRDQKRLWTIGDRIVDAGYGDRLRRRPIASRERDSCRRNASFRRVG